MRRVAKEHVIGADQGVDQADERDVYIRDDRRPYDGTLPWFDSHTHDEKERRHDDERMTDHVLEELEVGKGDVQIRGKQSLHGSGERPEVRELDQLADPPPTRRGSGDQGEVAEREGQR